MAPNRNGTMSIVPLLAQSAFDPETIDTLVSVFEAAWRNAESTLHVEDL